MLIWTFKLSWSLYYITLVFYLEYIKNGKIIKGKSRGLMVKAEDSQLSGCGLKSRRLILDGVSKITMKKRNKGCQMGHTKKVFFLMV